MNRIMSFMLGAICMLLVVLALYFITNDNQTVEVPVTNDYVSEATEQPVTSKKQINKQIAYVNNDLGVTGTDINVASSLIDNMVSSSDYEVVTTTYNDAVEGLEDDQYVAYVVFGADYSSSLYNITTDQLPSKAKINVRINSNLSDKQKPEVTKVLLTEYNYIHSTISYVYITYLLDAIHSSQNEIQTVIENEEYMNSVASSVAEYSTTTINNFEDYLENPDETEVELNTTRMQSIYEQNLEQVTAINNIDVDKLQSSIEQQQGSFMTSVSNSMLDPEMEVEALGLELPEVTPVNAEEFETALNGLLVDNTREYQTIVNKLKNIESGLPDSEDMSSDFQLPYPDDIRILHVLETIVSSTLNETPNFDNITTMADDPKYAEVFAPINTFILDYANWYNSNTGVTPDVCTSEDCFNDFNTEYGSAYDTWLSNYTIIRGQYQNIAAKLNDLLLNIPNLIDTLSSGLTDYIRTIMRNTDQVYVHDILAEGKTPSENFDRTEQYCSNNDNPSSLIGKLGCQVYNIGRAYNSYAQSIVSYNQNLGVAQQTIDEFNSNLEQNVLNQNQAVTDANADITETLTTTNSNIVNSAVAQANKRNSIINKFESSLNEKISNFNLGKNNFVSNMIETLTGYQKQLNTTISSVETTLYNDRKDATDTAKAYNSDYGDTSEYYSSNVQSLTAFTSILPNTRNGAEANFYIYDYFVNPLKVVVQLGNKSKDTADQIVESKSDLNDSGSDTGSSKKEWFDIKIMIIVIILISGLLFYLNKVGDDDE